MSVRDAALRILFRVDRGEAYADILLDRAQRSFPDGRDRALLTELVMGTLRRRGTLDFTLSPHLSRPMDKTDPLTRNALRLGAYQILYTRAADRAAVFETVEAAKRVRGEKIAGLVNAVLRELVRAGKEPAIPEADGEERMAATLSAPLALVSALSRSMGREDAAAFLASSLERPPFVIRANVFRVTRDDLLARLARAGMAPSPCRYASDGIALSEPAGVHADPGFSAGEYLVMDEGAQLIAPLLAPAKDEGILDACAAPGGKTTHLAALSGGRARIVATDLSEGRLRLLRETVSRTGAEGVTTRIHDFSAGPLPRTAGKFHKILVDAPCTGMGVIRRNPDAKWRFRAEGPADMARLQGDILDNAWASLRAGGLLVYCTCTPFREENEEVVASFLERHGDGRVRREGAAGWPGPKDAWTPEGFLRLSPHRHGTDGFFAALLGKSG
ncbi:MAG: 16S rRNA (cytosine(967)-C(5))-methyltransferase RsmB [Candidatus Deferrimicrobiaceae bacterium]